VAQSSRLVAPRALSVQGARSVRSRRPLNREGLALERVHRRQTYDVPIRDFAKPPAAEFFLFLGTFAKSYGYGVDSTGSALAKMNEVNCFAPANVTIVPKLKTSAVLLIEGTIELTPPVPVEVRLQGALHFTGQTSPSASLGSVVARCVPEEAQQVLHPGARMVRTRSAARRPVAFRVCVAHD